MIGGTSGYNGNDDYLLAANYDSQPCMAKVGLVWDIVGDDDTSEGNGVLARWLCLLDGVGVKIPDESRGG